MYYCVEILTIEVEQFQIVISNGLANFVTTFSDLAVTVTFGNFSKEFENFL